MNKFGQILIILLLGIAIGTTYHSELLLAIDKLTDSVDTETVSNLNYTELDNTNIKLCFTPPTATCGPMIADQINLAKSTVYMQAYGLTHPQIINALIKAKQRGVDVSVMLDRSNLTQKYSKMKELEAAGIKVVIDRVPGIAHNKIIIIDKTVTVTGSFNFTVNADTRNAENGVPRAQRRLHKAIM